jgi:intracellular sulfur oxidation DsrE/DsrF family protein
MTRRREFLASMGVAAAAFAIDPAELRASAAPPAWGAWDTSWLDRLATAKYRVVFNANVIGDGAVVDYAATFVDHFHEVHNTTPADTRSVVVFRRLGTPMAFNDRMWDRYAIGADTKVDDPETSAPARRNVFWRAGSPTGNASNKIETMHQRGMISLVCNVALGNIGRGFAEQSKRDVTEVQAELRANLVPGAILVPSGIYALIRAQNAGCAYMPGT